MRRSRSVVLGAFVLALGLVAGACGTGEDDTAAPGTGGETEPERGKLTVGSDSFAEAQIVGEMYAQVLENAGYEVDRQLNLDSREIRLPAMESGEIDIAPEYLASLLSVLEGADAEPAQEAGEAVERLEGPLSEKGLKVLEPSDVVDTNAFVASAEVAQEHGLTAVSDLADVAGDLTLGGPPECPKRAFCIPGLKEVYGVEFGDFKPLEYGATVTALSGGAIDVGLLFSTDGSIAVNNFVLLEDDQGLQAADNITPLVRQETLNDEIEALLNEVSAALDTETITELNKRANVDVEDPADLAREFLEDKGLL
jgi:osmoprotectant transport system substrate-binding protein